ncbi:MAG: antibiotic biosynthesis monooxygenase [Bacteroidota bacterium]|nr:antibiotic biosynthesis monooxygenase [Bacteroidota bacterium]
MLTRIVKMHFHTDKIDEFLEIFSKNKHLIRNFEGNTFLELYQDKDNPSVFFTYSIWQDADKLELYRQSELFNSVWSKTKVLFAEKPQAWSLNNLTSLK